MNRPTGFGGPHYVFYGHSIAPAFHPVAEGTDPKESAAMSFNPLLAALLIPAAVASPETAATVAATQDIAWAQPTDAAWAESAELLVELEGAEEIKIVIDTDNNSRISSVGGVWTAVDMGPTSTTLEDVNPISDGEFEFPVSFQVDDVGFASSATAVLYVNGKQVSSDEITVGGVNFDAGNNLRRD